MECINFCYSKFEDFIEGVLDIVMIDVFFILLCLILLFFYDILKKGGSVVVLIKL